MLVQNCVHKLLSNVGGATIKSLASSLHESFDCISHLQCIKDTDDIESSGLVILKSSTKACLHVWVHETMLLSISRTLGQTVQKMVPYTQKNKITQYTKSFGKMSQTGSACVLSWHKPMKEDGSVFCAKCSFKTILFYHKKSFKGFDKKV